MHKAEGASEVVCSPCGRKLISLCDTFESVSLAVMQEKKHVTAKRKLGSVLTLGQSPGNTHRKQKQVSSFYDAGRQICVK